MIAYIKGKLIRKEPTNVIIDVNGIGYFIHISLHTFSAIKDEEVCHLNTYLHVKEDAHTLYGFISEAEKKLFLNLISISGIGPSTGLMMLSSLSPTEIIQAIANEDVHIIQSVKGIGAKTAQRVILELKDKMKKETLDENSLDYSKNSDNNLRAEALSALVTLGINKNIAQKSIGSVLRNSGNNLTLEELIKLSLQAS
jgi:Holliday junction DNA helicase RuvA